MRTAKSLGSGAPISTKIRRMSHRSTAKNMPITVAGRMRNLRHWKRTGLTDRRRRTITRQKNVQELQNPRGGKVSDPAHDGLPRGTAGREAQVNTLGSCERCMSAARVGLIRATVLG